MKTLNYKILLGVVGVLIISLLIWSIISIVKQASRPPLALDLFKKTAIGVTTENQIDQLPNIVNKKITENGSTLYEVKRSNVLPADLIEVKDNVATLETIYIPEDTKAKGFITLPQILNRYGKPESLKQGSRKLGSDLAYYIYGSRGFALLASPINGGVVFIQQFKPMAPDEYIKLYGDDIMTDEELQNNKGE